MPRVPDALLPTEASQPHVLIRHIPTAAVSDVPVRGVGYLHRRTLDCIALKDALADRFCAAETHLHGYAHTLRGEH